MKTDTNLLNKVRYKYKSESLTYQKMFITTIILTINTAVAIKMVVNMKIAELMIMIIVAIIITRIIIVIIKIILMMIMIIIILAKT